MTIRTAIADAESINNITEVQSLKVAGDKEFLDAKVDTVEVNERNGRTIGLIFNHSIAYFPANQFAARRLKVLPYRTDARM